MIRMATQNDRMEIAKLLWVIFEDMELPLLKKISKNKLLEMVAESVADPTYRFGFKRGLVYEVNGEIAGIIFGYPAEDEPIIDEPFRNVLLKNGFDPNDNLFVDKETLPDEWYIDSVVVNGKFRGMGIGSALLNEMSKTALDAGYHTIGLNVDMANPKARKLYANLGYKKVADLVISDHQYEHMCKTLSVDSFRK
ncbi:GNAT family N-acetyltransferase [Ureibacillus sp. FSL E2-3493]|uniref:GNAT family N-acetyltransferase n=1 Tax=Ureibacillus sp. FSL E2-3493 TaxID=2921367 RepID=UPI00311A5FF7